MGSFSISIFVHSFVHLFFCSFIYSLYCKSHFLNLIVDSNWKSQQKFMASKQANRFFVKVLIPLFCVFNTYHPLCHFKRFADVIKRNCNNKDLISTGNKLQNVNTANDQRIQREMKNWSPLLLSLCCVDHDFILKMNCEKGFWSNKGSFHYFFIHIHTWYTHLIVAHANMLTKFTSFHCSIIFGRCMNETSFRYLFAVVQKNSKHFSLCMTTIIMNNEKEYFYTEQHFVHVGFSRVQRYLSTDEHGKVFQKSIQTLK